MIEVDKFELKKVKETEDYGEFIIGPLPKGFGHTIGNSLRRILLSSIDGSAVTSVRLNGVRHEYAALEGIQDDVLAILMKLKSLATIVHTDEDVLLEIHAKGKKSGVVEIKASDIEPNADVEVINKDLLITTLTSEKAKFDAEITIRKGVGIAAADESIRREIGNLPLSASFNPVQRMEVEIQQARVGQKTDYDQVLLKIYTNKTKKPSEALLESFEIYDIIANRLVNLGGGDAEALEKEVEVEEAEEEEEKILVSEVNMSTRLTNSLLNAGIATLNELDGRSLEEVMNFRGMGKKSFEELKEILADFGLSLKE